MSRIYTGCVFTGTIVASALLLGAISFTAQADPAHRTDGPAIGVPAKPSAVTRTIEVIMQDNAFHIETLHIKPGETIRFVLKNQGEFLHEFNIGTAAMHASHRKEMARMAEQGSLTPTGMQKKMAHGKGDMPDMQHDDPNSVLVAPHQEKELIWTFPANGTLEFACNIPGHYESGMVGKIRLRA